jgi:hypothetical protein
MVASFGVRAFVAFVAFMALRGIALDDGVRAI